MALAAGLVLSLILGSPINDPAPRERIPDDLQPFAALNGVRLTIRGLSGGIVWSVIRGPGEAPPEDPYLEYTGFSRTELLAVDQVLHSRSMETLKSYGVSVVDQSMDNGRQPELLINISWFREPSWDRFAVEVDVSLQEQAILLRQPSYPVTVPTWNVRGRAFATRATFRNVVEGFVRNYVTEFGEHYRQSRAWANRPATGPLSR
jgi:hypothetical protein